MTETRISLSYLISVPYLKIAVINSQLDNILHTRHQVVNFKASTAVAAAVNASCF